MLYPSDCVRRWPVTARRRVASLTIAIASVAASSAHSQPVFQGLGFFPGAPSDSQAFGVSGDGLTVTGSAGGGPAWYWRAGSGMTAIPGLATGYHGSAVNADGTVIVGSPGVGGAGFRWVEGSAAQSLPGVPTNGVFTPSAVSADGTTIAGTARFGTHTVPAVWNLSSGYTLPNIPQSFYGDAYGVSGDGSVVAGRYWDYGSGTGPALRWTAATGTVVIGPLGSVAYAVSADGRVIVGRSGADAFRWTAPTGIVGIGAPLPQAEADAVNGDGSVIVGHYYQGGTQTDAFIWDPVHGSRNLQAVLLASGAGSSLDYWRLTIADGVSADGRTVVGSGIDPLGLREAYIAHLPGVAFCYANCDASTAAPILNVNDFICFQTKFANGDTYANCDQSTMPPVLNVNDFVCFQLRFAGGCP